MKGVFTNYKIVLVSTKQHRPPARLSLEATGFLPTWLPTFSCISLFPFHVFAEGCHRRTPGSSGTKKKKKKARRMPSINVGSPDFAHLIGQDRENSPLGVQTYRWMERNKQKYKKARRTPVSILISLTTAVSVTDLLVMTQFACLAVGRTRLIGPVGYAARQQGPHEHARIYPLSRDSRPKSTLLPSLAYSERHGGDEPKERQSDREAADEVEQALVVSGHVSVVTDERRPGKAQSSREERRDAEGDR